MVCGGVRADTLSSAPVSSSESAPNFIVSVRISVIVSVSVSVSVNFSVSVGMQSRVRVRVSLFGGFVHRSHIAPSSALAAVPPSPFIVSWLPQRQARGVISAHHKPGPPEQ